MYCCIACALALAMDWVGQATAGYIGGGAARNLVRPGLQDRAWLRVPQAHAIEEVFEAAVTRRRSLLVGNLAAPVDFSPTGRFRGI